MAKSVLDAKKIASAAIAIRVIISQFALTEVIGPITDFCDKLASYDGLVWWNAFKRFLRKEDPWFRFPLWRQVKLGCFSSQVNAMTFLRAANVRIYACATRLFSCIVIDNKLTDVELVKVSGSALGFRQKALLETIYERAYEMGLELCPSEVALQVALGSSSLLSEQVIIASEPLMSSEGDPALLIVGYRGTRFIDGLDAGPDVLWSPTTIWVFVSSQR